MFHYRDSTRLVLSEEAYYEIFSTLFKYGVQPTDSLGYLTNHVTGTPVPITVDPTLEEVFVLRSAAVPFERWFGEVRTGSD